ncbi:hypothetical protein DOM21_13210 [Bacteriovorax stolpii]|jgi:hypothetical protein|uniref:hypothetical protein n=1 Tax=Bacteriovorax stolpii TaxID=960 RepID=UPI001158120A|nr:hypothetical protein [Bacteriovorax stolpii]QDK42385.1 hypothetical protein DOM21_13210 [Bacteriovorax stolpii]
MENNRFAKLANGIAEAKNHAERHTLIKDALDYLVKEFNIEFGDFKVYVRQGKVSERIEINKSLKIDLKAH